MADYVALMSKDPDSEYGVDFPDFPGCVTAGQTPEEARELALEALCFHIEGMIEGGEPIPLPSPIETIRSDEADSDAIELFLVRVPDDLLGKSRQPGRTDDSRNRESCRSSWQKVDAG